MNDFVHFILMIGAIVFPFAAMVIMWRRTKAVRDRAYHGAETLPVQQAWEEPLETENGLSLVRTSNPNDDLIALGAKEKQATWTITNQ